MQGFNVIWVFNPAADKVLMCKRHKEPYKGLYNLVGGKIENGEDGLAAAYRELQEETGIVDITLTHLMDFTYYKSNCYVEVYYGTLRRETEVQGDEKELVWLDANENFFDMGRFAGEGNIGHICEQIKINIKEGGNETNYNKKERGKARACTRARIRQGVNALLKGSE